MSPSGKAPTSAATGPESSSSIDAPKSLGTNNTSFVTVAKTDNPQDFGRDWEKGIEDQHDRERKPRKLVFFADGTFADATRPQEFKDKDVPISGEKSLYARAKLNGLYVVPSDVYHLAKAVKSTWTDPKGSTWDQEIHYQHGIGCKQHEFWKNQWGLMTGTGVGERIRDGYSWLSNRYQKGDEVFIVGYSRGAFIARSVGGMISKYGLMKTPKPIDAKDPDLVKLYTAYKEKKSAAPDGVTVTGGNTVQIQAICCWETVGALGLPDSNLFMRVVDNFVAPFITTDYTVFHDVSLNNNYVNAFHMLALTDHKLPFPPTLWEKPNGNLEQVWFPGQHEDVGGGLIDDHGASFVTLAWLMDKLDSMLGFDETYFETQVDVLLDYYGKRKDYRKWGEGSTSDTQTVALGIILARASRSPGWYYRRDPKTGDETSELLVNTNEKIHQTVRLRLGKPNRGAFDQGPFQPTSLSKYIPPAEQKGTEQKGTEQKGTEQKGTEQKGTKQKGTEQNGTEQKGKFVWVWNGWTGTKELEEAEVGKKYELKLQTKLDEAAKTHKSDEKPDTSVSWFKVVSNTFAFRA